MATIEDVKKIFEVGDEFECFYRNGDRIRGYNKDGSRYNSVSVVSRVSEKSCWLKNTHTGVESRVAWTTLKNEFENGLYHPRGDI